jgi:hypothetical protein
MITLLNNLLKQFKEQSLTLSSFSNLLLSIFPI